MDTTDNNESPKRRIEDQAQAATINWDAPGAPVVPAASSAPGRIPLRAVASMCVKPDDVSFFATPAAKLLEPGHYMLSVQGAAIACTNAGTAPAASAANQAQPIATFEGYDGESLKPVFTLIGTLNAGDKLFVCAPAQAAAPSREPEPDWSDSKTLPSELWKNPLFPMRERLEMADGAVRFRDDVIANLRQQLARQQAAPAAIPEGLKEALAIARNTHGTTRADSTPGYYQAIAKVFAFAESALSAAAMPALLDKPQAELRLTPEQIDAVWNGMPGGAAGWLKTFGYQQFAEEIQGRVMARAVAIVANQVRPTDDELWDATMRDRDQYQEWADKLAGAIAKHFGVDIGEHSNMNCPWAEALEAVETAGEVSQGAAPTALAERNAVLEEAAAECERMKLFDGARQESYAHDTVWKAAEAIRALKRAAQPNIQEAGK